MSLISLSYHPENNSNLPVELPLSKSIAARMLIISFISGKMYDRELPDCADSRELSEALKMLRKAMDRGEKATIDLGSGATSLRFFVALCAAIPGVEVEVICSEQLRVRPLAPLLTALCEMGADIKCPGHEGYPPLKISGRKLTGGKIKIGGNVSSQFASALLLISPLCKNSISLHISHKEEGIVSRPYIELTQKLIHLADNKGVKDYNIEPDWSAASYFYESMMLAPYTTLNIKRLTPADKSIQGDSKCAPLFSFLGIDTDYLPSGEVVLSRNDSAIKTLAKSKTPIYLDMGDFPDLVPALCVGMALSGIKFELGNIDHLKAKESNRINALIAEMEKLGYALRYENKRLIWDGRRYPVEENITINSYNDHRIAMAFAPAVFRFRYLAIEGAECVEKSFPDYFNQLRKLGVNTTVIGARK